jgi:hypothetical protein
MAQVPIRNDDGQSFPFYNPFCPQFIARLPSPRLFCALTLRYHDVALFLFDNPLFFD